jgi:hypothetical protein
MAITVTVKIQNPLVGSHNNSTSTSRTLVAASLGDVVMTPLAPRQTIRSHCPRRLFGFNGSSTGLRSQQMLTLSWCALIHEKARVAGSTLEL